ncbi:hypothetical protein [Nocardia sp. CA-145437]|uniref:hypothetical protein n=1 Tax=Nocardia sp. CA-145437 TaxID=3239980 RepID=UPI003D97C091
MNAIQLALAMGITAPLARAFAKILVVRIALKGVPAENKAAVLRATAEIVGDRRRGRTRG